MGVYGNMLLAFTELFRNVDFWHADAMPDQAGWIPHDKQTYRVIILDSHMDRLRRKFLAGYKVQDMENIDILYTNPGVPIEVGMFLQHPDTKQICRVTANMSHIFVGGFQTWSLERVAGAQGFNQEPQSIKDGSW